MKTVISHICSAMILITHLPLSLFKIATDIYKVEFDIK